MVVNKTSGTAYFFLSFKAEINYLADISGKKNYPIPEM